jgi:hypothetical protein
MGSFPPDASRSKNDLTAFRSRLVNFVDSKYTTRCPSAFLTVVCTNTKIVLLSNVGVAPKELLSGNKRKTNPNKIILFIKLFYSSR